MKKSHLEGLFYLTQFIGPNVVLTNLCDSRKELVRTGVCYSTVSGPMKS